MDHLTPEELVDLAEDLRGEPSAPHLQTCAACRLALANLRAMMTAAAGVEVPEPSPLFWDHLSARVGEAVRADGRPQRTRWPAFAWPRVAAPAIAGAFGIVVLGVMLTTRLFAPVPAPSAGPAAPPAPEAIADGSVDDPALTLVTDLAEQMDWEAASELHVPVHQGVADEAIDELSEPERREMRALLQEELGRPGI